jgi:hypothetical protein
LLSVPYALTSSIIGIGVGTTAIVKWEGTLYLQRDWRVLV